MRRNENNKRPTAGCLSVPLFNQKKRSRLPLTSNPSGSDVMCPGSEYRDLQSFTPTSHTSYTVGYPQVSTNQPPSVQRSQWGPRANQPPQQTNTWSPASCGSAERGYAPIPHPRKPDFTWSQTGSQRPPGRQDVVEAAPGPRFPGVGGSAPPQPGPPVGRRPVNPASSSRQTDPPRGPFTPEQPASTPAHSWSPRAPAQNSQWTFKSARQRGWGTWPESSFAAQSRESSVGKQHGQEQKKSSDFQARPSTARSLRILTAVIEGMRHWGQYKDKVPMTFEIFATLDSAVTTGKHGAKNFLLRDGKDAVQCVYYENDQALPRLIRGQVHRCVGNYDREQDLLVCASVRAASPSEQRNAQEAVKTSDAEMRSAVQALHEI